MISSNKKFPKLPNIISFYIYEFKLFYLLIRLMRTEGFLLSIRDIELQWVDAGTGNSSLFAPLFLKRSMVKFLVVTFEEARET